jgi:PAS domain S-box-containing protein
MSQALTALFVEDSADDAELLAYELRAAGLEVCWTRVETEAGFRAHLGPQLDIILSDFSLPRFSTPRALVVLREFRLEVPLVIVSGTIGEERAVEMLKAGATDYVLKSNLKRLPSVVRRAIAETRERTARRRMELQLKVHTTALEAAANGILITDQHGTILFANHAFAGMSGCSQEQLLGTSARLLKSAEHGDSFYRELWATILAGRVWQGRITNRRPDGGLGHEELTITPVKDAGGGITHYIAVKQDVTERARLEEQLRQSQKMESIGLLAGGVAHDFNNLLTVIQGHAALLGADHQLPATLHESAEEILLATERAASLTRQLLAFSRRQILQPRRLNLNEVLDSVTKMLRRLLGENISLQLRPSPKPAWVQADQGMLEQVLINLAVNARDAMPQGGTLLVKVSREQIDETYVGLNPQALPGDYNCISVSDTGCGIPPEVLPRIFEPFFTTKGVGKGTGLGLGTVYGIVKQHYGWLTVYSEIGRGTAFRIYLPAVPAGTDRPAEPAAPAVKRGQETILVVEDEATLRALIRQVLEHYGYTVIEAGTGRAALEAWRKHAGGIDLLLTDIIMPDHMTGFELAQMLQAGQPTLPAIFSSGYCAEVVGKDVQLEEGRNFLQKPYPLLKLVHTVRTALDNVQKTV